MVLVPIAPAIDDRSRKLPIYFWLVVLLAVCSSVTAPPIGLVALNDTSDNENVFDWSVLDAQQSQNLSDSVDNGADIWSILWSADSNESVFWVNETVQDEFKANPAAAIKLATRAAHLGKKIAKALRSAGKFLKKWGAKLWKKIQKYSKKAFKAAMKAADMAMVYGPQAYQYYQQYQEANAPQAQPFDGQGYEPQPGQDPYAPGPYGPGFDPGGNRFMNPPARAPFVPGVPDWVIGLIAALALLLVGMGLVWCFMGGKADYRHRRNIKRRRRNQRGRRDSESSSSEKEEDTEAATQMTTMASQVTAVSQVPATTVTEAASMATQATSIAVEGTTKAKGKKKKKKLGVRKALDRIEQSIYAPKKKKGGKAKKKQMEQSTIATELPTAASAMTTVATEAASVGVEASEDEEAETKPKSKSKSKSKSKQKSKKCVTKKGKRK